MLTKLTIVERELTEDILKYSEANLVLINQLAADDSQIKLFGQVKELVIDHIQKLVFKPFIPPRPDFVAVSIIERLRYR